MSRARKRAAPAAQPSRLYSLTGEQARTLRDARANVEAGEPGLYWSWCGLPGAAELVDGSCAEVVEIPQSGGTRSVSDPRPCEWVDRYIVPTAYGLELLEKAKR